MVISSPVAANNPERWKRIRPSRNGCSINFHDAYANRNESAISAAFSHNHSSRTEMYFTKTIRGQCHKYSEYEISPMATSSGADKTLTRTVDPPGPEESRRAAARHGTKPEAPGNAVFSENQTTL